MIYFTSDKGNSGIIEAGVYSLNSKTNELKTIYKVSNDYYLRLRGKQNDKLLLEKMDWMNSPGPCFNIWVYAFENPKEDKRAAIKSLSINGSNTELSSFSVPKEKYESTKAEEAACGVE
jgi:hypothetical protein